jgi:hypothetical protein
MKTHFPNLSCLVLACIAASLLLPWPARAQTNCSDYFAPITNGDGTRYPLQLAPLVWRVVGSGIYPVKGSDGMTHLAYALMFTDTSKVTAALQAIDVIDAATGKLTGENRVLTIKNEDVTGEWKVLSQPETLDKANYSNQLAAGQSGVMFFDVAYADTSQVPCAIAHRVKISTPPRPGLPLEFNVTSRPLKVSTIQAFVLGPPFKGDGWVDANGCCREIGPHRFVTNAANGTLDPSEQFAIDWIKINSNGKAIKNHGDKPEDWLDYGTEVLAVGDGTVVEAERNLADVPPNKTPENLSLQQIAGNRVILDLGSGRYVMYAHLAPNSITVHVGDRVQKGQKIGLLGNTGNSDAPHLHFQVMDKPSSLDSTALPFVFENMQLLGRINLSLDALDRDMRKTDGIEVDNKGAKTLTNAMPLSLDVVSFK